ncbi:MAG: hypothetical protein ACE5JU_21515 [Candidatus Binatia bacterium]
MTLVLYPVLPTALHPLLAVAWRLRLEKVSRLELLRSKTKGCRTTHPPRVRLPSLRRFPVPGSWFKTWNQKPGTMNRF